MLRFSIKFLSIVIVNYHKKRHKKTHKLTCVLIVGAGNPVPDIYAQKVIVLEIA